MISLGNDNQNSIFQQALTAGGTSVNQIIIANRERAKNGYVYIYVSNESKDFKVYFAVSRKTKCFGNNLKVTHTRGPLLSEEGYYPFGMTMSAISSTAGTIAKNNYKFNAGTELTESFDINYYETYCRQYDAQLGRFTGVDALAEQTLSWSPYQFGYNNPALFNDPTGLFADYTPETVKASRRNSRLNNGYIDIITGHPETADAQYFLSEGYDYNLGGGAFNINFAYMSTNARGERGFWLPFIGPSEPGRNGELPGVVVGVKFLKYENQSASRLALFVDGLGIVNDALGAGYSLTEGITGVSIISTNKIIKAPSIMKGVEIIKKVPAIGVVSSVTDALDVGLDIYTGDYGKAALKGTVLVLKNTIRFSSPIGFAIVTLIDLSISVYDLYQDTKK